MIIEKSEENNVEVYSVYYYSVDFLFRFQEIHIGTFTSEISAAEGTKKWFKRLLNSTNNDDLYKSIENFSSVQEINNFLCEWYSVKIKDCNKFLQQNKSDFVGCIKHKLNETRDFPEEENAALKNVKV